MVIILNPNFVYINFLEALNLKFEKDLISLILKSLVPMKNICLFLTFSAKTSQMTKSIF